MRPGSLPLAKRLLLAVGIFFFRLLARTIRVRFSPQAKALLEAEPSGSLLLLWHNRLALALIAFSRYRGRLPLTGLVSASKDGAILAQIMHAFGVQTVRGSSSRRAVEATRELFVALEQGRNIVITPDGPRGPCYRMKAGTSQIAIAHASATYLLGLGVSRCWKVRSWDGFIVPRPFSTLIVDASKPSADRLSTDALQADLNQLNHEPG